MLIYLIVYYILVFNLYLFYILSFFKMVKSVLLYEDGLVSVIGT